ncbi:MAG TPA: DUF2339 domain-containing protein [Hyphomicrobiales bacterium]|nr:DUF2339 domain-containing protein [Hyphomicrobiales bacterium]
MTLLGILALLILLGALFGWLAFFRNLRLERELRALEQRLQALSQADGARPSTRDETPVAGAQSSAAAASPAAVSVKAAAEPPTSAAVETAPATAAPVPTVMPATPPDTRIPPVPKTPSRWQQELKRQWMVWLGGGCVGLAGVFLVKYSMDQGYLGPLARVVAGVLTGIALHVAAGWLRRRQGFDPAFAALAGGGSLTLFAALLAALHLYSLLAPGLAFALLALVAVLTMGLALWHGAPLAILGLLGAYAVPLLVGGSSDGMTIALVYALVIAAAALLLMRWVYRRWLWLGMFGGVALWFMLALDHTQTEALRGVYLAVFAYLLLAVPRGDWLLRDWREPLPAARGLKRLLGAPDEDEALLPLGLLIVGALQLLAMALQPLPPLLALNWLALPALLLVAAGRRAYLQLHPVLLLAGQLLVWGLVGRGLWNAQSPEVAPALTLLHRFCLWAVLVHSGLALYNLRGARAGALWTALAVVAPPAWLALDWLLTPAVLHSLQWPLWAVILAAGYGALAALRLRQGRGDIHTAWLLIGSHLAFALAVAMQVREASLTLVLALQLISLASLMRRFDLPQLGWLLKAVVLLVTARLSLNPWLWTYPTDIHWSLWTYGGSALCCAYAAWLLRERPDPGKWAQGAALHLGALFCWAEIRYWLYDGHVYALEYSFLEATLNQGFAGVLALLYHWRAGFSAHLARLYRVYSAALLLFALANYAAILIGTLQESSWMRAAIGPRPLWNLLLPAFGLPLCLALAVRRWYLPRWREFATGVAALALFVFINLEIHHLWQQRICLSCGKGDGELYTYTVVWLALAAVAILGGIGRWGARVYTAGMLLLLVVVAKLFLVDMGGLQGLWRVASFMGMGLGLLALGYLHRRLERVLHEGGEEDGKEGSA